MICEMLKLGYTSVLFVDSAVKINGTQLTFFFTTCCEVVIYRVGSGDSCFSMTVVEHIEQTTLQTVTFHRYTTVARN